MDRHLAIGDIHGCSKALRTLCDFVDLRDDDTIITLGDYCNKGPDTFGAISYLIHLTENYNLQPLRGNHDLMMLNARNNRAGLDAWLDSGGDKSLRSYAPLDGKRGTIADVSDRHWEFLEQKLLPFVEIETHFFVHGSVLPHLPLQEQPDFMLYWQKHQDPVPHKSGKTMVCGHTSQKSGLPKSNSHSICIDTWAHGGGWLSCLDVTSGRLWQANQKGDTRALWMDEVSGH
ncbi:MAG: metallophosphoesterase family protein [Pirellulaceae bacterium]|nr:metallophosphoesterase family protein [Pirellulaceae bacterium]